MTDFQVRPWGIRRTRKSVVPLKQQAASTRFFRKPDASDFRLIGQTQLSKKEITFSPHMLQHCRGISGKLVPSFVVRLDL